MSLRKQTASGVKWTAASAFVITALQFFRLAILARLLDKESFGLMAMMMVVIGFGQAFADMGISNAIIHRQNSSREQLSSLYWLNLFAGILIFLTILGCSSWIAVFYSEPRLENLMPWAALIFLIIPAGQQFQVLMQKDLQFNRLAIVEIASTGFGTVVAIAAAYMRQGVFSLILGQIATAMTNALLLVALAWNAWRPAWHFAFSDLGGYASFGLYQMGERSLNYFSWNLDKMLIGKILGAEPLGVYSVAYQIMIRPLSIVNAVITRVAFPVFSAIQDEDARLKRGYLKMIEMIAFITIPLYVGMLVVATPLVIFLLGPGWQQAVEVLKILSILGAFYSLANPIGSLLLAKGKANIGFWFNALGLGVYTIGILVGVHWGVSGVAWGILCASVSVLFPLEFWVRWHLVRMRPLEFFESFALFLLLAALMAAAVLFISKLVQIDNPALRLGLLVPLGATIYCMAVFRMKEPFLKEVFFMARGNS